MHQIVDSIKMPYQNLIICVKTTNKQRWHPNFAVIWIHIAACQSMCTRKVFNSSSMFSSATRSITVIFKQCTLHHRIRFWLALRPLFNKVKAISGCSPISFLEGAVGLSSNKDMEILLSYFSSDNCEKMFFLSISDDLNEDTLEMTSPSESSELLLLSTGLASNPQPYGE